MRVVQGDGRHMYLEKFDQNGDLGESERLGHIEGCSHATFLDEERIVVSNPFVSSVI